MKKQICYEDQLHSVMNSFFVLLSEIKNKKQKISKRDIQILIIATFIKNSRLFSKDEKLASDFPKQTDYVDELLKLSKLDLDTVLKKIDFELNQQLSLLFERINNMGLEEGLDHLYQTSQTFIINDKTRTSSVERKVQGSYMTPGWLAQNTIQATVKSYLRQKGVSDKNIYKLFTDKANLIPDKDRRQVHRILGKITIVDPACGTGIFIRESLTLLLKWITSLSPSSNKKSIFRKLVNNQIYGVDRDPLAVTISKITLAVRALVSESASVNVVCGDSLTGKPFHGTWDVSSSDNSPNSGESSLNWNLSFPDIAARGGFEITVGNPPWERLKLLSREFFEINSPEIAEQKTSHARKIALNFTKDNLKSQFEQKLSEHKNYARLIKDSNYYHYSASGDINLYPLFVERALQITCHDGSIGMVIPSGLATDFSLVKFFSKMRSERYLQFFFDFENREKIFPDVDGRYRFAICILNNKPSSTTPKYAFFLHSGEQLNDAERQLSITEKNVAVINPNTKSVPIVRSKKDLQILLKIHKQVPVLDCDYTPNANTWSVNYRRFFDMTNDSDKFISWENVFPKGHFRSDGFLEMEGETFARVYEGRMITHYDHRAASCVEQVSRLRRPNKSIQISDGERKDPNFLARPRYVVSNTYVRKRLQTWEHEWFIGFMDIGSATNRRTMTASVLPICAAGNKVPLILPEGGAKKAALLLANLNSFAFDFALRQHIGNITLNWYILRQCPIIPFDIFTKMYINDERIDSWIQRRVLEITYTSTDLTGWARELGQEDSHIYKWNNQTRRQIQVELDALFFALYGFNEEDIDYVMETFPIVRRQENKSYGYFSLKHEIIKKWRELKYILS